MSTRIPGKKVVLPNPLLIKVEIDPKKLVAGRGAAGNAYFAARRTGASDRINALGIVPAGLPTGIPAAVIGRRGENKLAITK